nr:MAG TPA: Cysteine-rich secretory protein family [Caudoviricetes sp.]
MWYNTSIVTLVDDGEKLHQTFMIWGLTSGFGCGIIQV